MHTFEEPLKKRHFTEFLIVHCADTPDNMDVSADEIHDWHLERGWAGIGYHFVIRLSGQIELGRPMHTIGAHVAGNNHNSVGICMVGGKAGKYNFTPMQEESLIELLRFLKRVYPHANIRGHRDFDPTKKCPSFNIRRWIEEKGVSI